MMTSKTVSAAGGALQLAPSQPSIVWPLLQALGVAAILLAVAYFLLRWIRNRRRFYTGADRDLSGRPGIHVENKRLSAHTSVYFISRQGADYCVVESSRQIQLHALSEPTEKYDYKAKFQSTDLKSGDRA